jgi:NADH-quinone oxidoreductase subunit D
LCSDEGDTYGNIEGLMNHFKLIMNSHGICPPREIPILPWKAPTANWVFMSSATAKRVHTGFASGRRVSLEWPDFNHVGRLYGCDIVATFGSINMIAGELDR